MTTRGEQGTGRDGITIRIDGRHFAVQLNDTRTARELANRLPVSGDGSRWGDEIYFGIGLILPPGPPQEQVEIGDVAYWEPGKAICIFYGPTPASVTTKPQAASAVTVIGRIRAEPADLRRLGSLRGIEIRREEVPR